LDKEIDDFPFQSLPIRSSW